MTGWLIALAIIVLLAILPLGVSVKYDADGPVVKVIAGFLKIKVFPTKPKEKKEKKPKKEKKTKEDKKSKKEEPAAEDASSDAHKEEHKKPSGGSVLDFLPLVKIGLDLLNDFRWKLRVNRLELKLIMAGGDPCDLATNYGRAWMALGNFWPRLESNMVIKKKDVEIECDFASDETRVIARLDLTITLGRILYVVFKHGVRAVFALLKIMKSRKGGASK